MHTHEAMTDPRICALNEKIRQLKADIEDWEDIYSDDQVHDMGVNAELMAARADAEREREINRINSKLLQQRTNDLDAVESQLEAERLARADMIEQVVAREKFKSFWALLACLIACFWALTFAIF